MQEKLVMGSDQRSVMLNSGFFLLLDSGEEQREKEYEKRARPVIHLQNLSSQFAIQEVCESEVFQQTQWIFLPQTYLPTFSTLMKR